MAKPMKKAKIFEQQQQQQQRQQRDIPQLAAEAARRAAGYAAAQAAAGGSDDEDEDGDDSDDGSDDEAGAAAGQQGARRHIYNADALHQNMMGNALHEKLEDIAWLEEQAWEEGLVVTSREPTQVADVDDDLARELAFYNQALSATVVAISRFQAAGKPWLRPPDYYAEMVKGDEQMARIKDRLMYEQQQIDQATERRKAREQKAYAKQVQAEKVKERAQEKKRQIQQVQQLRKQREKSGFAGELDFDAEMSGAARRQQQQGQGQHKGQRAGVRIQAGATPNKKRQMKDAKFGFGGRKRLQKQNDAFSAADMSGYKPGKFDDGFAGKKQGGGGGGARKGGLGAKGGVKKGGKGGGNRPGKARRQQMKQRKG
ncbi:eukaryotic rRNA processing [Scenedesmus sp. NREL 46B-D3]|nr:eukaryotic rRNA processing [Scenedesmus sp. NREL 46B-D3]